MQVIKFKPLHPLAKVPSRTHSTDACFDVVAVSREIKDGYISYNLGFSTEIPAGWEAKVYPRSSISNYDLVLTNGVGVIDSAYRGEWGVRFKIVPRSYAFGTSIVSGFPGVDNVRLYGIGDRVAQIQFQRVPLVFFEVVEELADSERAAGGFGSTGA